MDTAPEAPNTSALQKIFMLCGLPFFMDSAVERVLETQTCLLHGGMGRSTINAVSMNVVSTHSGLSAWTIVDHGRSISTDINSFTLQTAGDLPSNTGRLA